MLLFILVTVERVTQLCRDIFYRERKKKTQMVNNKKKKKVSSCGSITDMYATVLPEHTQLYQTRHNRSNSETKGQSVLVTCQSHSKPYTNI